MLRTGISGDVELKGQLANSDYLVNGICKWHTYEWN